MFHFTMMANSDHPFYTHERCLESLQCPLVSVMAFPKTFHYYSTSWAGRDCSVHKALATQAWGSKFESPEPCKKHPPSCCCCGEKQENPQRHSTKEVLQSGRCMWQPGLLSGLCKFGTVEISYTHRRECAYTRVRKRALGLQLAAMCYILENGKFFFRVLVNQKMTGLRNAFTK